MSGMAKLLGIALMSSVAGAVWLNYGSDTSSGVAQLVQSAQVTAPQELSQPVEVQATPIQPAPAAPAPQTSPAASPQPAVDETALRYFARQGDTKRLQAEIARLRALYPGWTPPVDPAAAPVQVDSELDRMWQLYAQGKYAEVRQAIAQRQTGEANWQAPKDLLDRLAVAETRERLINASNLKQYETVIRSAAGAQSLLTCSDLDVLWRVAEAFAQTNQQDRARDAYQYVLRNCPDPAERLATMQKAVALLDRPLLDQLLALEKPGNDGSSEFASIRADLVRKAVATGAGDPPQPVAEADVSALEDIARTDGQASDSSLLGWYYLRKDDPTKAEQWFRNAVSISDDALTAQGLGLALIALERPAEAEEILYKWLDESDELRKDYLAAAANLIAKEPRTPIDEAVLKRIVPAVAQAKDAATAQQLGWYAHAFGQEEPAAQWFSTALRWNPDDEAAAYGLAVVQMALGDKAAVAEIQRNWSAKSERIATITEPSIRTAAVGNATRSEPRDVPGAIAPAEEANAPPRSAPSQAPSGGGAPSRKGCSSTDFYSSATGSAALTRAWCLMELDRPAEAVQAFEAAIATGNTATRSEAAWGQSLANIRLGLTDKAAVSASRAPLSAERARDLEASILSMRATGFFDKKRYAETLLALDQRARIAPERRDLMVLRGYAYLALYRIAEARQVFEAIAAAGDPEGARGLAAIRAAIDPAPQN